MPFGYFHINWGEIAFLLVALGIEILYLLTLQKALRRVSAPNRTMEPGMVWLMLVPCVNFVWQFHIATQVPKSLRNEFRARGQDDRSDYGRGIALTNCILTIIWLVIEYGRNQRVALSDIGIALLIDSTYLVLFFWFWQKVAIYSRQLAQGGGRDDGVGILPGGQAGSVAAPPDT
jgi:hypothetical protein